jgi:hypothetical protein
MLLGLLSAPLGLVIAYAGLDAIMSAVPPTVIIPYYIDWNVNPRVIVYTTVVSAMTGLLFGLVPALQAGRATACAPRSWSAKWRSRSCSS